MITLVINSGSTSIKYQIIDSTKDIVMAEGLVERIGSENGRLTHKYTKQGQEQKIREEFSIPDHVVGLNRVSELLFDEVHGVIPNPDAIDAVGHRVVHGGEKFTATCVITDEVKQGIKELFPLAPLHNPANLIGIEVAEQVFPTAIQVAVFDTAFHQTLNPKAFRYAIPNEYYKVHGVRKYGFHGTSHKYVSRLASEHLGNPEAKVITIHLGGGSSITAVKGGKSVDTSLGMGTFTGLIMGSRSGDVDPAILFHLMDELKMTPAEVLKMLTQESGTKGLTGYTDMRDILSDAAKGSEEAEFALDLYCYRIQQFIGSYMAALNGVDAIVFTAGIGENSAAIRERVCKNLDNLGIKLDQSKNEACVGVMGELQSADSKVKVLAVPTNEEKEIAMQTEQLLKKDVLVASL